MAFCGSRRLLFALLLAARASGRLLLDRNCWPEHFPNYALCCHDLLPPDPRCFEGGRSYERCCRCPPLDPKQQAGLGVHLTRKFFGPLLCDGPTALSRPEDFLVNTQDGQQRLLRVYIYDLDRRFNAEILNRLQMGGWAMGSDCDYGLTPCTESWWASFFSVFRQWASDVVILLKFLSAPEGVLTTDPNEADLFLVPYFVKQDCAEGGSAGQKPCWGACKCSTGIKYLFESLEHYNWSSRGRHLFLATGDTADLPLEIQAQPLLLSLGASFCGGNILVPSPNLDPVLQPRGKFEERERAGQAPERHIFIYFFGQTDKTWREEVIGQVARFRDSGAKQHVALHTITGEYSTGDVWQTTASPSMVLEEMYRSIFCPVIQGDLPYQKRLFDSAIAGCLPVVVAFPSHVVGKDSWFRPGGPPVERMVPFFEDIDWRSFVVEVPMDEVVRGRFVEALLSISNEEISARQAAMRLARPLLRFDFSGSERDAFSLTVQSVWRFLDRDGQRSSPAGGSPTCSAAGAAGGPCEGAERFDCGKPPQLEDRGMMYGYMACCPI